MDATGVGYVGVVDVASFVEADERWLAEAGPAVRVGVVAQPAVSFGVGHRPTPVTRARSEQRGWSIVPRSSGGTSLYHARGDLLWSVVLPRTDPRVGRDYAHAYGRLGAGLVHWLSRYQVSATWTATAAIYPPYCLLNGLGQTLQVDGRALAGAAQHLTRRALLHHGVVCMALDAEAISSVFEMPPEVATTGLTGVRALGATDPAEAMAGALARALQQALDEPAS